MLVGIITAILLSCAASPNVSSRVKERVQLYIPITNCLAFCHVKRSR